MPCSIVSCVAVSQDGSLHRYEVCYSLESGQNRTSATVVVMASDMSNPIDLNEMKSRANSLASSVKVNWESTLPPESRVRVDSVVGPVTL